MGGHTLALQLIWKHKTMILLTVMYHTISDTDCNIIENLITNYNRLCTDYVSRVCN